MEKLFQPLCIAAAFLHVSNPRNAEKPTVLINFMGWTFSKEGKQQQQKDDIFTCNYHLGRNSWIQTCAGILEQLAVKVCILNCFS